MSPIECEHYIAELRVTLRLRYSPNSFLHICLTFTENWNKVNKINNKAIQGCFIWMAIRIMYPTQI
jgi:hypothetical protein